MNILQWEDYLIELHDARQAESSRTMPAVYERILKERSWIAEFSQDDLDRYCGICEQWLKTKPASKCIVPHTPSSSKIYYLHIPTIATHLCKEAPELLSRMDWLHGKYTNCCDASDCFVWSDFVFSKIAVLMVLYWGDLRNTYKKPDLSAHDPEKIRYRNDAVRRQRNPRVDILGSTFSITTTPENLRNEAP